MKKKKSKAQRARAESGRNLDAQTIAIEEWSFASVPVEEIDTCFYYEYARERDDVRELVHYWREQLKDLDRAYKLANTPEARRERRESWIQSMGEPREDRPDEWGDITFENEESANRGYWRALAEATDWTFAQMLIKLPEFPDTPWQKLGPSLRKKWGHWMTFYTELEGMRGGVRVEPWDEVIRATRFQDFRMFVSQRHGELVAFRIDWREGVEKVIDAFEAWARQRNPARIAATKKKPRKAFHDRLKQLGVVRLKRAFGNWKAVQQHTRKVLGSNLYGSDLALWRKARLAAMKRTKEMFSILECAK